MAVTKYTGTGTILDTDYKDVAFKGFTKSGKYIMITVKNAVNLGNIDWTFADKGEMIPQTVFTGTYSNNCCTHRNIDDCQTSVRENRRVKRRIRVP